jgi:uncharacterized protein YaaW (UPF0174 family)
MNNDVSWKKIAKELQESLVAEIAEHLDTQDEVQDLSSLIVNLSLAVIKQQGVIEYLESFVFEDEDDEVDLEIFPTEDTE